MVDMVDMVDKSESVWLPKPGKVLFSPPLKPPSTI